MLSTDERDFLERVNKGGSKEELLTYYHKEREKGFPHVYLTGKVTFHELELFVDSSCLIPRMETELLVERVLLRMNKKGAVLDLCAGSGAIGLSLKKLSPSLSVTLSDVSNGALQICKKNALANLLEVKVVEGDFLEPFKGVKFSTIVCNPPYVSLLEYTSLEKEVKDHEPKIAITDGEDGFSFYKKLSKQAFDILEPFGLLCLEIGKDQGVGIRELFFEEKWEMEIEKDYSNHDRFVFLKKRG